MQRGILIDHPEGDIDLLKRRLLGALELTDSQPSDNYGDNYDDEDAFDSAISIFSDDQVQMPTKKRHDHQPTTLSTWEIRIFAANGLMRADTWATTWNEMERVDVEIMPYIPSELRRELDLAKRREEVLAREDEKEKKIALLEEQVQRLSAQRELKASETVETETKMAASTRPSKSGNKESLPPAYRKKEISLNILLRNYIYLLAQDTRNVAIFGLSLLVLLLSMQLHTSRNAASTIANTQGLKFPQNTTLQEYQHIMSDVADTGYSNPSAHVLGDTSMVDATATAVSSGLYAQPSTEPERPWEVDGDEIGEIMSD
ncbi:hypothetical protein MBLNU457_g0107t1 [Dothideomycetes sp. NU457]